MALHVFCGCLALGWMSARSLPTCENVTKWAIFIVDRFCFDKMNLFIVKCCYFVTFTEPVFQSEHALHFQH